MTKLNNRTFWLLLIVAAILLTAIKLNCDQDYADRIHYKKDHSEITDSTAKK